MGKLWRNLVIGNLVIAACSLALVAGTIVQLLTGTGTGTGTGILLLIAAVALALVCLCALPGLIRFLERPD